MHAQTKINAKTEISFEKLDTIHTTLSTVTMSETVTVGAVVDGAGSYTVAAGQVVFLGGEIVGAADSVDAAIAALNAAGSVIDAVATIFVLISDDNSASLYSVLGSGANEYTGNTFTLVATFDAAITLASDIII
jgi:predicted house-cleaning NTP pyrophosphatase (Maf/HAM1 superfamily)